MQLTKEQIEFLDRVVKMNLNATKPWILNSEGKVDVDGRVDMSKMNLTQIPVKFGKVDGGFNCSRNKLTSLEGCPDYVSGSFLCSENNLTSLEGCPDYVGGDFYFGVNNLNHYFKNIKEEDFKHWDKLYWRWWNMIEEYPFLINIAKNYVINKETFIVLIKDFPKTKIYLR
jgi:hypothetical protein